jgi:hypothetical protein
VFSRQTSGDHCLDGGVFTKAEQLDTLKALLSAWLGSQAI